MVEHDNRVVSVERQCALLDLARSTFYYVSIRDEAQDEALMRLLDEEYTRHPFYGVRRMTHWLQTQGCDAGLKRVRRLLRLMGLEAIYPKPRLSIPAPGHRIYPYLLRGVAIERPNQVWSTDITYIRMARGFVYLTAILDWFSRYVLSWRLSVTLENDFCLEALDEALRRHGQPDIFNSDQGSQFTSDAFTGRLLDHEVRISMDGRGRAFDNIFIERLWRTVKYEEVYLRDYDGVPHARESLAAFFAFYNEQRPHQALGNATPWQRHRNGSLS
jgi:putative transposase